MILCDREQSSVAAHNFALDTGCRGHPCRRKRETHRGFHIKCDSDDPLLPVLESPLLADRFITPLRLDPLNFALVRRIAPLSRGIVPLRIAAITVAPTPAILSPAAIVGTPAAVRRHYLDRSHHAFARRPRRDHRIF